MQLIDLFPVNEARLDERKIHVADALRRYKDDPSIYVTFSDLEKVGINPQSKYDTPLGIYCYPLNAIWDELISYNLPFAQDRPYVHVLQSTGNMLDLNNYNNMGSDYEKLYKMFMSGKYSQRRDAEVKARIIQKWRENPDEFEEQGGEDRVDDFIEKQKNQLFNSTVEDGKRTALVNSEGGRIWNITRLLAVFFAKYDYTDAKSSLKPPVLWNSIFRQLGYDGAVDRAGQGIIHSNEPTQAVFFSKAALRHLETIKNNYDRPIDTTKMKVFPQNYLGSFDHFIAWLTNIATVDDGMTPVELAAEKHNNNFWLSRLKDQWAQLRKTGESENFKFESSPQEFEQQMLAKPNDFISAMLNASQTLIPIVLAEIMHHPQMQTKDVWMDFIRHVSYEGKKYYKFILSKPVIELHAKCYGVSVENAWKDLSNRIIWDILEMRVKNRAINLGKQKSLDFAKHCLKNYERYVDPKTMTDEALLNILSQMIEDEKPY